MGKLSKSIKRHIKTKKIDINKLEKELIGDENYKELTKNKEFNIYTEQCKKIIEDYEYNCKETSAKNINKISEYYDKNFKNGIKEFKKKIKNNITELTNFLKELEKMKRNLIRCLNGRIQYKYLCIEFNDRNKEHDHEIIKGILYFKKLEQFLEELREEILNEKEIQELELEEQKRLLKEKEKEYKFYNNASDYINNTIINMHKDNEIVNEEWNVVMRKFKKYL